MKYNSEMKSKIKKITILALLLIFAADFANAGLVNCGTRGGEACKLGDLVNMVVVLINFLLGFAGLIAIAYIFMGGARYVLASASPDQAKAAKDTIVNAITGFVLTMGAYLILNIGIRLLMGDGASVENLFQFWPQQ
jgi:hypothetical protein